VNINTGGVVDDTGVVPAWKYYKAPAPPDQKEMFGWMTRILPYMDQEAVYNQIDFTKWPWWQHPLNERIMPMFICPGDYRSGLVAKFEGELVALAEYMAVSGTDQLAFNGVLYVNSQVRMSQISDGTSNTLFVGERPSSTDLSFGWWFAGSGESPNFGATDVCLGVNEVKDVDTMERDVFREGELIDPKDEHRWHYWSLHIGGTNFLMCDGSVRFVAYDVGQRVLNAAATRAGSDPNNLP